MIYKAKPKGGCEAIPVIEGTAGDIRGKGTEKKNVRWKKLKKSAKRNAS
jgi:hypothetical protein